MHHPEWTRERVIESRISYKCLSYPGIFRMREIRRNCFSPRLYFLNYVLKKNTVENVFSSTFSVQIMVSFFKKIACGELNFSLNGTFFQNGTFFSSMVGAKSVPDAKQEINCTRPYPSSRVRLHQSPYSLYLDMIAPRR